MLPLLAGLIGPVSGLINKILDKTVEDKDLKRKLKAEALEQMVNKDNDQFMAELKAASGIIMSEASGESSAQRNWRPHLMYLIMGLIVFNGCIVPLTEAIWDVNLPILEAWNAVPDQMWSLLKIGLGGYVGGRTLEKVVRTIKDK